MGILIKSVLNILFYSNLLLFYVQIELNEFYGVSNNSSKMKESGFEEGDFFPEPKFTRILWKWIHGAR